MSLRVELERQGSWLFRWRSYLPLLILPLLLLSATSAEWLERTVSPSAHHAWEGFCVLLSFIGLALRCKTVGHVPEGTSGRNTKCQEAKILNTTGVYSIVRHPLYLGNFLIILGIALFMEVWWFPLIAVLAFWIYYERIMFVEEEFLRKRFGAMFEDWAQKTPAFLPKLKNWQPLSLPFSLKTVLRREYTTFFAMITAFTLLDILDDVFAEGQLEFETPWIIIFTTSLVIYLSLRLMKKKTGLLKIAGR